MGSNIAWCQFTGFRLEGYVQVVMREQVIDGSQQSPGSRTGESCTSCLLHLPTTAGVGLDNPRATTKGDIPVVEPMRELQAYSTEGSRELHVDGL